MIRTTQATDKQKILTILADSGQFDEDALAHVDMTMDEHFQQPEHAIWLTAETSEPVGIAYCAPEPMTSGTWNLLMLWMQEGSEGQGFGSELINQVEQQIKQRNARLLIVETSGTDEFVSARAFYEKSGFTQEARIKDFFDSGDDKLVYTKKISD